MNREEAIKVLQNVLPYESSFAEAIKMAIEALKAQDVVEDLTQDLADRLNDAYNMGYNAAKREIALSREYERAYQRGIKDATKWIPCSERLPEDLEPVNITWVNHNPTRYYADIKDKPFTATGHYCNGRWWWYSATCQDYLQEYGISDPDFMDDDIEVIAWMPLPSPF